MMDMDAARERLAKIRANHEATRVKLAPEEQAQHLALMQENAIAYDAYLAQREIERIADGMLCVPHHYRSVDADYREVGSGLYLFGPVGTGKTSTAAGIVRAHVEARLRCRWVNIPVWLSEQRESFSSDGATSTVASLVNCDLLVMDDIGVERATEWALETLYVLVSQANDCDTPVVVTSNLTISQLGKRLGDRVVSRLAGMCEPVKIGGSDRRLTQRMRTEADS